MTERARRVLPVVAGVFCWLLFTALLLGAVAAMRRCVPAGLLLIAAAVLVCPEVRRRARISAALAASLCVVLTVSGCWLYADEVAPSLSDERIVSALEVPQPIAVPQPTTLAEAISGSAAEDASAAPASAAPVSAAPVTAAPVTAAPVPTATPLPGLIKADIEGADGILITEYTAMVSRGGIARVAVSGEAGVTYRCEVEYSSGKSSAKGLGEALADANGCVVWSWRVGAGASLTFTPVISIWRDGDKLASVTFRVTDTP